MSDQSKSDSGRGKAIPAVHLSDADWHAHEDLIVRFETALHSGQKPRIVDFLTVSPGDRFPLLVELVAAEVEYHATHGTASSVEQYQLRFPELLNSAERVVQLEQVILEASRFLPPTVRRDRKSTNVTDGARNTPASAASEAGEVASNAESKGPSSQGGANRTIGRYALVDRIHKGRQRDKPELDSPER